MSNPKKCWACHRSATYIASEFRCNKCGVFRINETFAEDNPLPESYTAKVSGWIYEHQGVEIDTSTLTMLMNLKLPGVHERALKLLRLLDSKTTYLGEQIQVYVDIDSDSVQKAMATCWASEFKEITYLLTYLATIKFIERMGDTTSKTVKILPDGFMHLEEIKTNTNSNIGFCAMAFDPNLNDAWYSAIKPAIEEAGYEPIRIDEHPHNEGIMDKVLATIRQSTFVVADLTTNNNGAYMEAGFAMGLGIEVIFTCRDNDFKPHFDVQHIGIIKWSNEDLQSFKEKLRFLIERKFSHGKK